MTHTGPAVLHIAFWTVTNLWAERQRGQGKWMRPLCCLALWANWNKYRVMVHKEYSYVANAEGKGRLTPYLENTALFTHKSWDMHIPKCIVTTKTDRPGEEATKPISSVPLFCEIFRIFKTHISYQISRLYLTGVSAAQLRWHLSKIQIIQEVLLPNRRFRLRRNWRTMLK